MQKLVVCIGLPGSGKTTWARNFIRNRKNWRLVSNDDVRVLLSGSNTYNSKLSPVVYQTAILYTRSLLKSGHNVILDGTYVEKELWKAIAEKCTKHSHIYAKVFDITPYQARILGKFRAQKEKREIIPFHVLEQKWSELQKNKNLLPLYFKPLAF